PQSAMPSGTGSAQRPQRARGAAKRAWQAPHTRRRSQLRHTAHKVGRAKCEENIAANILAAMSDPSPSVASVRALDAQAIAHQLHRLAGRGDPPWLHREVARRMAERLSFIKLKPERVIDWWAHLGASAQALAQACPRAQRTLVEPTTALHARGVAPSAPW